MRVRKEMPKYGRHAGYVDILADANARLVLYVWLRKTMPSERTVYRAYGRFYRAE